MIILSKLYYQSYKFLKGIHKTDKDKLFTPAKYVWRINKYAVPAGIMIILYMLKERQ